MDKVEQLRAEVGRLRHERRQCFELIVALVLANGGELRIDMLTMTKNLRGATLARHDDPITGEVVFRAAVATPSPYARVDVGD